MSDYGEPVLETQAEYAEARLVDSEDETRAAEAERDRLDTVAEQLDQHNQALVTECGRLRRSVSNVEKTVTNLRRALGKALQLLVAYNLGHPEMYPPEVWEETQREAAGTNLASSIHDPACRAALAEGGEK